MPDTRSTQHYLLFIQFPTVFSVAFLILSFAILFSHSFEGAYSFFDYVVVPASLIGTALAMALLRFCFRGRFGNGSFLLVLSTVSGILVLPEALVLASDFMPHLLLFTSALGFRVGAAFCSGLALGIALSLCGCLWASLFRHIKKRRFLLAFSASALLGTTLCLIEGFYLSDIDAFLLILSFLSSTFSARHVMQKEGFFYSTSSEGSENMESPWKPFVYHPLTVGFALGGTPFLLSEATVAGPHLLIGIALGASVALIIGLSSLDVGQVVSIHRIAIVVLLLLLLAGPVLHWIDEGAFAMLIGATFTFYLIFHAWLAGLKIVTYDLDPERAFMLRATSFFLLAAVGSLIAFVSFVLLTAQSASHLLSFLLCLAFLSNQVFEHSTWQLADILNGWFSIKYPEDGVEKNAYLLALDKACETVADSAYLTKKEGQVFRLLARGYNSESISQVLSISPNTARSHTLHIYQKLPIDDQQDLISLVEQGMVDAERERHISDKLGGQS